MMKNRFLFLGTGASSGVPVIGCECAVCQSDSPFNKRFRPSALLRVGEKHLLIDAGQDFRTQALKYHIKSLDGLLITHAHHDHISGIDDLRALYYKTQKPLPVLLSESTARELTIRYDYLFGGKEPRFVMQILSGEEGTVVFQDIPVTFVTFAQGGMKVNGFRIGNLAYLSDIRDFPPTIFSQLKGVEILIVSALRYTTTDLHFSVDDAVDFIKAVGAATGWLTHISHELDHEKTNAYLPPHIKLAYDGLEFQFR